MPSAQPSNQAGVSHPAQRLKHLSSSSRGRIWLFRFLAVILVPACALGLLEISLRLFGYGHPTSYFLRQRLNDREMLTSNPWFGLRFFPPALARSPVPVVAPLQKEAGVYRVFVFGESAAMGDPQPAYSAGRMLQVLLQERFPHAKFEIISTAMTAINSHAVLPVARECARYHGDLWVIYMGNNEMVGPFGANTVFGVRAPPGIWVRAYLGLQQARLGQWLAATSRVLSRSSTGSWEGMKMFEGHQVRPDAPVKEQVYKNFRENLDRILAAAGRARVPVVLSTVASNLRDCAPFGTDATSPLSDGDAAARLALLQAGASNAARGLWPDAVASYERVLSQHPMDAELHFRIGEGRLALGNQAAARSAFVAARDLDALPFRTDSTINALIAQAAKSRPTNAVSLVDAEQALEPPPSSGIPGLETFYDHVHLTFEGNYRLARSWAEQVTRFLPPGMTRGRTADWVSPELCAQRLGFTEWSRAAALEEMVQRVSEAPFLGQVNHSNHLHQLSQRLSEIRARLRPEARQQARSSLDRAVRTHPEDHWLHQSYAEFLSAGGELAAATAQIQVVCDLLPWHYAAYLQLGRLLARQKRFDEARGAVVEALRRKGNLADAHFELAQIDSAQGRWAGALAQTVLLEKFRPGDPASHLLRARIYDQQNRREEAIASLREAVSLRPSSWEARYLLGLDLVLAREFDQAREHLEEVIRLRPDYASGHLNLGYAMAQQGRFKDAANQFRQTLRLEPGNAQAQQFLESIEHLIPRGE